LGLDYVKLRDMSSDECNQIIKAALSKTIPVKKLQSNYIACIDPGHGGSDPGAISSGAVKESSLNLAIALAMRNYLQGMSSPYPVFTVIMTRTTDIYVSLEDRYNIANNIGAKIFVSIHCNSFSDTAIRGTTACYSANHDITKRQDLAYSMVDVLTTSLFLKNKDAYYQDIKVLRETGIPAALVECGFISNTSDLAILQNNLSVIGYYLGLELNVWCQVNI
jgi:N-acetylmuramoyl-L-alanine amidase